MGRRNKPVFDEQAALLMIKAERIRVMRVIQGLIEKIKEDFRGKDLWPTSSIDTVTDTFAGCDTFLAIADMASDQSSRLSHYDSLATSPSRRPDRRDDDTPSVPHVPEEKKNRSALCWSLHVVGRAAYRASYYLDRRGQSPGDALLAETEPSQECKDAAFRLWNRGKL
jgi:hypothetical protein